MDQVVTSGRGPYSSYTKLWYDKNSSTQTGYYYPWSFTNLDNERDQRPKPDDLLSSMTDLPLQYKRRFEAGSTGAYEYQKNGDWWTSSKEERSLIEVFPYVMEAPVPGDWIVPLRMKIKDVAINLGTTLAEYRQSARMFGSAARGITNAWRTYRKTRKRVKKLDMCSVAASELVYTYGVAPLLSDVYDSVEALRLRLEHPLHKRFHVRRKDVTSGSLTSVTGNTSGGVDINWKWKKSHDVVCHIWFNLEKASLFTLGNPAELVWEVVPYSFVVDWMIPIGDYLISLDALKAADKCRLSITTKELKECRWDLSGQKHSSLGGGRVMGLGSYPATASYRAHARETTASIPFPPLPKFELSGSARRLMNATALLVNARGCKGRTPRYSKNVRA